MLFKFCAFLATVSVFSLSADSLQCYFCSYDTSLNSSTCNATLKSCSGDETSCNAYSTEREDGSRTFSKDCVPSQVCEPDFCQNIIDGLGRKSCNVSCCQSDKCNKEDTFPAVKDGVVSSLHWSSSYLSVIMATWIWFFILL